MLATILTVEQVLPLAIVFGVLVLALIGYSVYQFFQIKKLKTAANHLSDASEALSKSVNTLNGEMDAQQNVTAFMVAQTGRDKIIKLVSALSEVTDFFDMAHKSKLLSMDIYQKLATPLSICTQLLDPVNKALKNDLGLQGVLSIPQQATAPVQTAPVSKLPETQAPAKNSGAPDPVEADVATIQTVE